ncbi:MAG: anthranilate phosphoribosyltransferase, partial [Gemmatimonadetes bacterium]|nr:anthranilate phosphoribosyltransferase [Gemmatimonadota bacterium]
AGVTVAKHGNRAMSSACGSADALEALGVKIDLGPDGVKRCLAKVGIGFMFAPAFHPAMKYAGPPRREIGIRTVFNLLGPVTNPAGAARQIIGMADGEAAGRVARALALLGTEHALIVRGEDGADEVSVEGPTRMWEVIGREVSRRTTRPADFGLPEGSRRHLFAPTLERSLQLMRGVLEGRGSGEDAPPGVERSARNVVVMNAAAALLVAGRAQDFAQGAALAAGSIDSGAARGKLDALVALSRKLS